MSQSVPKSKENGVKSEKSPSKHVCPPGPHAHPHGAGDEDSASEAASEMIPIPENIAKRVNALKNIHLEVQKIEQDMYTKLFLLEAEQHKKMASLLQKRADVIQGKHEPTEAESTFKLKEDEEKPETAPANEEKGIPDFWLTILQRSSQTAMLLNEKDCEALKSLVDVRSVYTEKPLGFKLEFEFKENPFFTNTVLTRSYEFGTEVSTEDLYLSSGLAPKTTAGCLIQWKEGKDTTKTENVTFQRNKKTGERRQIKKIEDQDSFFSFFQPAVTDLTSLSKIVDDEATEELSDKAEQAEVDFELASYIRTRVIPRALLLFTGDDDDDMSYGGEDDYDEEDEDDEEGDSDEDAGQSDSDDSGDAGKKNGPGGKAQKQVKGPARR